MDAKMQRKSREQPRRFWKYLAGAHWCHGTTFLVCSIVSFFISVGYSAPRADAASGAKERVLAQIAASTGVRVLPGSVEWLTGDPDGGFRSAVKWHEILFLGSPTEGGPSDLYRAEVRSVNGSELFGVRGVRNVSLSPVGDDFHLTVSYPYAAVSTRVLGQVRSVTLFCFSERAATDGTEWTATSRFLARVTHWIESGRMGGIGKATARFSSPPREAKVELAEGALLLEWTDALVTEKQGTRRMAKIDVQRLTSSADDVSITPSVTLAKRPLLWMVDTVRLLPFVGPGPIEWAEGRFFAMQDSFRRLRYSVLGADEEETKGVEDPEDDPVQAWKLATGLEIGKPPTGEVWPPPRFDPPVYKRRIPGEGIWQPSAPGFVRALPGAPPAFLHSVTRPDGARPYIKVHLFAMDMRQLGLHMVGGHEDPRSTTGISGTGQIPRRPEIMERVVAAFNGAFKTEHGAYGMVVERDILLPPQNDSATVASFRGEQTAMGSWPKDAPLPEDLVSLRQNMDPLVENGVVNPRKRYLWGFTLDEDITKMHTVRSGLCMSDKGYLVYAWGEDLTAETLGKAMDAAGCVYGMHLDMNPFHTAYIYYRFEELQENERPRYQSEVALNEMRYSPHRYINGAPKDFFFLTLRDPSPGEGWSAEGLAQPAPAFVPAVFQGKFSESILVAVDMTRASAELEHGDIPAYVAPAGSDGDAETREQEVLVTVSLGPWSSVRGQLVKDSVAATLTSHRATLGVDEAGRIVLGAWPLRQPGGPAVRDAVQGAWLEGESSGNKRVTAIGQKGKWLVVGNGAAADLQQVMKAQGVQRVLSVVPSGGGDDILSPVALRGENGMLDLRGNPVSSRNRSLTHLKICAKPRPLGAKRLESIFSAAKGAPRNTEAKGDDKQDK